MDGLNELEKLEYLSLISKITSELFNHTGLNDKTLGRKINRFSRMPIVSTTYMYWLVFIFHIAEFVINLHEQNRSLPEFKKVLNEAGAEFPESFIANLDRLILKMNPKYKKKGDDVNGEAKSETYNPDEKAKLFPGLAMPNDPEWVSSYENSESHSWNFYYFYQVWYMFNSKNQEMKTPKLLMRPLHNWRV